MRDDQVDRYLRLLGVARRPPGVEALRELVRAHLTRVPFENVSKLHRRRTLGLRDMPDLDLFLDGIERFNFGGTCYAANGHLNRLLSALGYRARLCGADMSSPDVHIVSIVELDGRELLVDVGYAAPFIEPLPRDARDDVVIELGRDRFVLRPQDAAGRSRLDLYRDGALKHGYLAKPQPRRLEEFAPAIADSFRDEATFMNATLLARFFPGRSLVIHNLTMIESSGREARVRALADKPALIAAITDNFGIPPEITRDVVADLPALGDAWG